MRLLLWVLLAWLLWTAGQDALTVAAVQTGPAVTKKVVTKEQARVLVTYRKGGACRPRKR